MSETLPIRVTVLDTWDEISLEVPSSTPVADVKRSALAKSRVRGPAGDWVLKYQGAELYEQGRTLADAGVPPHAALIALRRRRTAVR